MLNHRRALTAVFAAAALSLVGCSSNDEGSDKSSDSSSSTSASTAKPKDQGATKMTLDDAYCKAKGKGNPDATTPKEKQMMTGCFGVLKNDSDKDMTLTGFAVEGMPNDAMLELHETVDGTMKHKPEGFTIPAGQSHELKPGGDHMMLMNVLDEIPAGSELKFTLKYADGSEQKVDIPVREQASGEENYDGTGNLQQDTGMDHMDHDGHEGHDH